MTEQQHANALPGRLNYLLGRSKTTVAALARALGVSRQAVSMYTVGTTMPNAEKLCAIADYFNVSADWLLGRTDIQEIYDGGKHMTGNEYQCLALRTASGIEQYDLTLNGVMGLNGEAGECIDIVKKHLFQGHPLDTDKLLDELGDVLWYVAITADGIGVPLENIMQHNIDKLRRRYPEGFDVERSIHREDNE